MVLLTALRFDQLAPITAACYCYRSGRSRPELKKEIPMKKVLFLALISGVLFFVFMEMRERHAASMAASLRQIKSDNIEAALNRINKHYAEQADDAARAAKSRDAMFEVEAQEIEANRRLELAQIEYNKQMELGTAKTDDDRANIEAKYKAQASAANQKFNNTQFTNKQNLLLAKADEAEAAAQAARDQIAELTPLLAKRIRLASEAQAAAAKAAY